MVAVTKLESDQHKLMEVIRRTLSNTERPNPTPEIPDILERLQQISRESVPNNDFNEILPFLQPGWRTVNRSGGVTIIPPQTITDCRRAENDGWFGRAGPPLGSVLTLGPGTQEGGQD